MTLQYFQKRKANVFFQLIEELHLINFRKGGEKSNTPVIIFIDFCGPLPFTEGQNDTRQQGLTKRMIHKKS